MDNNERNDLGLTIDKDAQIHVTVNSPDSGTTEIDLGRVFHNMKVTKRLWAWVLVLCLVVGICAPLLLYQFQKNSLTVSSVVTLRYDVDRQRTDPRTGRTIHSYSPVRDLTAPDGTELDLNMITSSYILQRALDGMELSQPITAGQLRGNIRIERILTEDSRRQQEVASSMIADKSSGAYTQVQGIKLTYENRFVVTLTNGFSSGDDDKNLIMLEDSEISRLLDRILSEYNDYLVLTYANLKLPDDQISVIDTEHLDVLESLDLLRTAVDTLYDYCDNQPNSIKEYRSSRTGLNLTDLMTMLKQVREVNVDYLYSYVYTNSIVKDKDTMITNYRFQLRDTKTKLDTLNEKIATNQTILDTYKNDEIFVSMQESDTAKSTKTTTDYYNSLVLEQARYYSEAAVLKTTIADLEDKITALETDASVLSTEAAETELNSAINVSRTVYGMIRDHMDDIHSSAFYTEYIDHSTAFGKLPNFLEANVKKIIIGAVAGAVIACGLWFLSALATEMRRGRKDEKEAERV